MKKILFFLTITSLICCKTKNIQQSNSSSQIVDMNIINEDKEKIDYKIRTILLHKKNDNLSLPILSLNSDEKLKLSFDDLRNELSSLYVTIEHYDSKWKKSNLIKSEYIEGFMKDEIIDYEYSFNTLQNYIHYQYDFPSENLSPSISGNYKIKVFDVLGDTIFSEKFMILEKQVNIEVNIKKATLSNDRKTKHEIDFIVNHPNLNITDPYNQINIIIKQNNKDDNAISDLKPMYVRNNSLIYDYNEENTFFGNNEFRHFDIKSVRYFSDRIENISNDSLGYNIFLFAERKRSFNNYSIQPDLNGKFYIKCQEARNSNIEAEYVNVNFRLNSNFITYGDVYVVGELTNWELKEKYKLEYDFQKKCYQKKINLKQGYYNYHYAIKDTSLNYYDVASIEGTHYQTRNNYQIYIYYKDMNDRYEKLIGFTKELSKELF